MTIFLLTCSINVHSIGTNTLSKNNDCSFIQAFCTLLQRWTSLTSFINIWTFLTGFFYQNFILLTLCFSTSSIVVHSMGTNTFAKINCCFLILTFCTCLLWSTSLASLQRGFTFLTLVLGLELIREAFPAKIVFSNFFSIWANTFSILIDLGFLIMASFAPITCYATFFTPFNETKVTNSMDIWFFIFSWTNTFSINFFGIHINTFLTSLIRSFSTCLTSSYLTICTGFLISNDSFLTFTSAFNNYLILLTLDTNIFFRALNTAGNHTLDTFTFFINFLVGIVANTGLSIQICFTVWLYTNSILIFYTAWNHWLTFSFKFKGSIWTLTFSFVQGKTFLTTATVVWLPCNTVSTEIYVTSLTNSIRIHWLVGWAETFSVDQVSLSIFTPETLSWTPCTGFTASY